MPYGQEWIVRRKLMLKFVQLNENRGAYRDGIVENGNDLANREKGTGDGARKVSDR